MKPSVNTLLKINPFKNTNKTEGQPTPKVAKKEITLLSFVIGFFIAAAFNVSLLEMFSIVPGEFPKEINLENSLFNNVFEKWTFNNDFKITPITIFGFLLTGFFLSFGSKFFHDLLDRLYYIKRAKRAIGEPETYFLDNPEAVANIVKTYESDFVMAAYNEAKTHYKGIDSVKAVSLCKDNSGYYVEVLSESNPSVFSRKYLYRMSDGREYNLRIEVNTLKNPIIAHKMNLGSEIIENGRMGTIGCLVKSKDESETDTFLVTCAHNLLDPKIYKDDPESIKALSPEIDKSLRIAQGEVKDYRFNHYIDAAIIRLSGIDPKQIENRVPKRGIPREVRILKSADEGDTEAWFCGAASRTNSGTVHGVYSDATVVYELGKKNQFEHELRSLLVIKNKDVRVSKAGDSGSLVLDRSNRVLGLLVAGCDEATFVIPMDRILEEFKVKII